MYAWEKPFHAILAEVRRREVKQIRYAAYLGCTYLRYIFDLYTYTCLCNSNQYSCFYNK